MDNTIIILVIIGAIIVFYTTKFMTALAKIAVKILLILIILIAILTVLFYKDLEDLQNGIVEKNNTFILYDNNTLYTAISLKPVTNKTYTLESFNYFNNSELQSFESRLNDNSLMPNGEHRIFIIRPDVLNKSYSINLSVIMDEEDLLRIMKSDDPYLVMAQKIRLSYNISEQEIKEGLLRTYGEPERMKAYFFAALLINQFQSKDAALMKDLKSGGIKIIPESLSFQMIKMIPFI